MKRRKLNTLDERKKKLAEQKQFKQLVSETPAPSKSKRPTDSFRDLEAQVVTEMVQRLLVGPPRSRLCVKMRNNTPYAVTIPSSGRYCASGATVTLYFSTEQKPDIIAMLKAGVEVETIEENQDFASIVSATYYDQPVSSGMEPDDDEDDIRDEARDDLNQYTRKELYKMAREAELEISPNMPKEQLINLLLEAEYGD